MDEPTGLASLPADRLPQRAAELRAHLLRRLALLEREVLALVDWFDSDSTSEALVQLRGMEEKLRRLLEEAEESAGWSGRRAAIVELWWRHRRAFEELATRCRRGYPVRPGQGSRGPRW